MCPCGQPARARKMVEEFPNLTDEIADRIIESTTLVGYTSPPGHNHDDNCWTREYVCSRGHILKIGKLRRCPACDWAGKWKCPCHYGEKVEEWPEDMVGGGLVPASPGT